MAIRLEYMKAAMATAKYEQMEDGRFFGTIPKFDGLWAVGSTKDEAAKELYGALEGWLQVHIKISKAPAPEIDGVNLVSIPKSTRS
ncbi:MAG: type II toxin-antitoxin system HicB family antitoxin [Deltaproteobacteria bacterium]|nr:type II toxin-antitoxin system HicB family antitoxin [Deltaproteobacteria bacterium]